MSKFPTGDKILINSTDLLLLLLGYCRYMADQFCVHNAQFWHEFVRYKT